jgi:hypothetical protein
VIWFGDPRKAPQPFCSVQIVRKDQNLFGAALLYEDELNFFIDEFCTKRFHSSNFGQFEDSDNDLRVLHHSSIRAVTDCSIARRSSLL